MKHHIRLVRSDTPEITPRDVRTVCGEAPGGADVTGHIVLEIVERTGAAPANVCERCVELLRQAPQTNFEEALAAWLAATFGANAGGRFAPVLSLGCLALGGISYLLVARRVPSYVVLYLAAWLLLLLLGCGGGAPAFQLQLPAGFPPPTVPDDNPLRAAKVELGRHLFHDRRLSANGTQA